MRRKSQGTPRSKMLLKCFLCARVFEGSLGGEESGSGSRNHILSPSQSSFVLSQVLGWHPNDDDPNADDLIRLQFRNVVYCSDCLEIISNLGILVSELEILQEKVSTGQIYIVERLRKSCSKFSERIDGPPGMLQQLMNQIVAEIDKGGIKKESELRDVPNNSKNQTKRSSRKSKSTASNKSFVRQPRSRIIVKLENGYQTAETEDSADQNLDRRIDTLDDFEETLEESILFGEESQNLSSVKEEGKQGRKNKKNHNTRRSRKNSGSPEVKRKKPKQCEKCGKVLSCQESLNNHVTIVHRGKGRFRCTLCNFTYQYSSQFKVHKASHGVKKFECGHCKRRFKVRSLLLRHKKFHEALIQYWCKLCSAGFIAE